MRVKALVSKAGDSDIQQSPPENWICLGDVAHDVSQAVAIYFFEKQWAITQFTIHAEQLKSLFGECGQRVITTQIAACCKQRVRGYDDIVVFSDSGKDDVARN